MFVSAAHGISAAQFLCSHICASRASPSECDVPLQCLKHFSQCMQTTFMLSQKYLEHFCRTCPLPRELRALCFLNTYNAADGSCL